MTDHSNAITDILVKVITDFNIMDSMGDNDTENVKARVVTAKQALYEAVNLQLPLPILKDDEDLVSTPYRVGYNKALDDVLTNLNVSFGISKEGDTNEELQN